MPDPESSLSTLYREWMRLDAAGEYAQALEISGVMMRLCRSGETPADAGEVCQSISTMKLAFWTECESIFGEILPTNPQSEAPWIARASALIELDRFDEAILTLENALRLNPNSAESWWRLGLARSQTNSVNACEKALDCLDKAMQLEPQGEAAWFYTGLTLSDAGRHEEALACFDNVIMNLNPRNAFAWYCKGLIMETLRKFPEAESCYARAGAIT